MSTQIDLTRYKEVRHLGNGAFGEVLLYECTDGCEHSTVAVKKSAKKARYLEESLKRQFLTEIEVLSKLEHRNIVRYLGHQEGKYLLILLEYMPGGSIEDRLKDGAFTENRTSRYTRHILEGLVYLHSKNIFHRDIKGANILLSSLETAKLADFGIAKELRTSTATSGADSMAGTYRFMAPEVVKSGEGEPRYGRKSDVWSVGCVVVQMLTTHPPWKNYEECQIIFAIGSKQPQYDLPDVSDEAKKFVQACFIQTPDGRPTADELLCHGFVQPPDIGSKIKIASISSTSATATFEPPSSGCFDRYSLIIHPSGNGETVTDIPPYAASPSSVLSNLLPGTKYKVTVNVVKRMDKGAETVKKFTTHIPSSETERRIRPRYKISSDPRGLCIIINNIHFDDERKNRLGSDVDEEKLSKIFEELKFRIQTHRDLKADDINDVAKKVAYQTDHLQYDCLVFCIMSHGGIGGEVSGTDGRRIEITTITDHFKGINCKALREKPKIFFIQACKGTTHQMGFETDSVKEQLTIPNEADFLIGYSTVPGFVSYRNETEGSWYIGTLVKMLDKYCDSDDLLSIMTMVTEEVCKKGSTTYMKQCPLPYTTLRKKVFLKRD